MIESTEAKGLGVMRVTSEHLRKVLRLPEGTRFLNVTTVPYVSEAGQDFDFIVESAGLRITQPGCRIEKCSPQYRQERIDNCDVWITTFDQWGP